MTRKAETMTFYTATPEMCHTAIDYGSELLPHDWQGKKFLLDPDGHTARLDGNESSFSCKWYITDELAQKIKASVATEETPTVTELMALKAENERMDTTITQQREELERLRRIVDENTERHYAFKKRVGEVAMEYAERHDWCDTVKEALDELGIEVPLKEYTFTLSVVYRVRGTKGTYGDPDDYDLRENAYLDTDVSMTLDGWDDFEVEYVQHDVMDVEEVTE